MKDVSVSRRPGSARPRVLPRILLRLAGLALRYPLRCGAALSCTLGATLFTLVTPRLLGEAVDQIHRLPGSGADAAQVQVGLLASAGLIVLVSTLRGLLTGAQGYLGESIAQHVGHDLRLAFFEKLQRLSFEFHDRNHSGDLIARGMLDLEGCRGFLESGMLRAITLLLLLGFGSWQVLRADWLLGLLSLSFVPFVMLAATRMGFLLRRTWTRLQEQLSDLSLRMEESLQGMRVVRAFSARDFELAKFDAVGDRALKVSNQRIAIRMRSISTMNFLYYTAMALVLLVGGLRVRDGALTVGMLTEFLTFMALLQQPVRQVGMIVNSSARASSSASRLFEVLDCRPTIADRPDAVDLRLSRGELVFESVSFRYPGSLGKQALSDISFSVAPGQTLGIVGASGSGKSTLAHLAARFYDASEGRISIDGQDIRGVTLASLRRAVSLVQQETFLFDASARDNIAYGAPGVDDETVHAAAGIAQIHDDLRALPRGYDTRAGERGVALSGGQRQRLSIARGLVDGPAILILDDTTAAVDAVTERKVRAALRQASRERTTLIIAHRLSSLMHADEILVLDDGRIAERGTHAQLVARGGHYAGLWALQYGAAAASHAGRFSDNPAKVAQA